ncbi:SCO family protein [Salinarimonas soli]|uniref:SCO family protein n=1 Tax=Salinarimonas soli TaxID=1638099 RepID=A0A5B2V824_9HYPH|nr:SCO family protein [Salinarimonas soli]KAA2234966.1 SCO family protein [Salinarimonas soli]
MSPRARRLAIPLVAFLFSLVALGVAAILTLSPAGREATAAGIGGPFALVNQDGRTVTERDFEGAPHLVFFGFTHCPDVCPTKLFEISQVLRAMGDRGRNVRALFVSVDPARDTPEAMKSYTASFDERIVGLTGDQAAVDAMVKAYRAFARKALTKDGDYTMEHTAFVYLMDKRGRFVGSFNLARPPEDAAAELARYL